MPVRSLVVVPRTLLRGGWCRPSTASPAFIAMMVAGDTAFGEPPALAAALNREPHTL